MAASFPDGVPAAITSAAVASSPSVTYGLIRSGSKSSAAAVSACAAARRAARSAHPQPGPAEGVPSGVPSGLSADLLSVPHSGQTCPVISWVPSP